MRCLIPGDIDAALGAIRFPIETLLFLGTIPSPLYSAGRIPLPIKLNSPSIPCPQSRSVWLEENIATTLTISRSVHDRLSQVVPQPYPQSWHTTYKCIFSEMTISLLFPPQIFPSSSSLAKDGLLFH